MNRYIFIGCIIAVQLTNGNSQSIQAAEWNSIADSLLLAWTNSGYFHNLKGESYFFVGDLPTLNISEIIAKYDGNENVILNKRYYKYRKYYYKDKNVLSHLSVGIVGCPPEPGGPIIRLRDDGGLSQGDLAELRKSVEAHYESYKNIYLYQLMTKENALELARAKLGPRYKILYVQTVFRDELNYAAFLIWKLNASYSFKSIGLPVFI